MNPRKRGQERLEAQPRLLSSIQELLGEVPDWCQEDERNIFPYFSAARKPHSLCQCGKREQQQHRHILRVKTATPKVEMEEFCPWDPHRQAQERLGAVGALEMLP